MKTLSLAAALLAVAFTVSVTSAQAQAIYVVDGGRTTVTLTKGFIDTLANLNIVPTEALDSQLFNGVINFRITSGAFSLATADGQLLHSGGVNLTAGTKVVRLDSFIINTLSDKPFVTGLVIADGKFIGRIKLFDIELPSDLTLPLVAHDGNVYLSGVKLSLDEEAATALNQAFGVTAFSAGANFGYSQSLIFLPLNADSQ
jgi:hypothetical protein